MRLSELYIDGFGHFHRRTLGTASRPVTVFYGPNEAGKSTLLAFVRAILLGFPRVYSGHYPPLNGGRHGGRLVVHDDTGASFIVERYAGSRGGLSVSTTEGASANPDALLRRLTGNATLDLFRNVFAFSLDELQAAASLNDASGAIYSAGQGAPGLPGLIKSLGERKGRIYLPRGNNQRVPALVNELRVVEEQLRAAGGNAERYGNLMSRKADIDRELLEGEKTLAGVAVKQGRISRLVDGWEDWLALAGYQSQLQVLPRYDNFPENAVPRLEHLEQQMRQASEDRDEAKELLRRSEEASAAPITDEDLLYDRERIEAMRRDRNRFDAAVRDLPEREGELSRMEADLAVSLSDLGHGWGEVELQAFDTSLVVRNQVENWKEKIAEQDERLRQVSFQLAQDRRALLDDQAATQEAQEKLPPEPPVTLVRLSEQQDGLRTARSHLAEYQRLRRNHETIRGQLNALNASRETPGGNSGGLGFLPIIALVLAGVVLSVAGIMLGGGALILGIVCGLILMVAAVMLWFMRKPTPFAAPSPVADALGLQAADTERDMERARQSLVAASAVLGIGGQPDSVALESVEARLVNSRNALELWNSANTRIEDAERRERLQERRLEGTVKELEAAEVAAEQTQQKWRQWLGERGLNKTLTPDAISTFLARVETARSTMAGTLGMRDRVAAIKHDIQEFREQVAPLAQRHGIALDEEDTKRLATVADELIGRMDDAQTAFRDRERAGELVIENRQLMEARERRLNVATEALSSLLAAAGTNDPEEFRRRARQNSEMMELERLRDERRRSLEHLSGPGERFELFCSELAVADQDQLGQESVLLATQRTDFEAQRDVMLEERGGIDAELAQLVSEEESSALRGRRNTLLEQLREEARDWSRLTFAEALLERTRHEFEQERQPGVVRHAQDFFSRVTERRYTRLFAPIGEQTITAVDQAGARKQPHELSRGTREQLYLALRFGLIREFGEGGERLPVVVDEALVNFDPGRARLAAEAFGRLAETNQVLVFTCHPSTAEMFEQVAGAQVVDIS